MGPLYEGLELGIGESILMKAVAASTGKTLANVKAQIEKLGDLGKVVEVLFSLRFLKWFSYGLFNSQAGKLRVL